MLAAHLHKNHTCSPGTCSFHNVLGAFSQSGFDKGACRNSEEIFDFEGQTFLSGRELKWHLAGTTLADFKTTGLRKQPLISLISL